MRIGTGQSKGMGDILLLTAICKHLHGCTVELLPQSERFSRFFQDQSAAILYREFPLDLVNNGNDHYAKCKMRSVGLYDKCYLPHIVVSKEEKARGKELIAEYKNPLAFVANVSSKFKDQREVSIDFWENTLRLITAEEDRDILQFGVSSNFTPFKQAIPMVDMGLDDLICIYSAIGDMVSVDTGDRHLMLACGGKTSVVRRQTYKDHHRWMYNSDRDRTIAYV